MRIREPVVVGQFYAADRARCDQDMQRLLEESDPTVQSGRAVGGIVPHAGWMCSGQVAAEVFGRLAESAKPDVIVLFGGTHRYRGRMAPMFGSGRWETPVGPAYVADRLADRILGQTNLIVDDPYAHETEHSIEVQMPFIVKLFPTAKVVPIMVPATDVAEEVGQAVGRTVKAYQYNCLVIGTTDLTHYGPSYQFEPKGDGEEALKWAKEENDVRFVDMVCQMRGGDLVSEARSHRNACSSGAAAATLGAVQALGATSGTLLRHTTSSELLSTGGGQRTADSVGYAGIIFT